MKKFLLSFFSLMMVAIAAHADVAAFIATGATNYTGEAPVEAQYKLPDGGITETKYSLDGICDFYLTKKNTSSSQVNAAIVRWYANDIITLTPAAGIVINRVTVKTSTSSYGKVAVTAVADEIEVEGGLPANTDAPWTRTIEGLNVAKSLALTAGAQVRFSWLEIEYTKGGTTVDPDPEPQPELTTIYEETFASSLGKMTVENKIENAFTGWKVNASQKYAVANSYVSGTNLEADSWMVSPVIDLTNATEVAMSFEQAFGFYFPAEQENFCTVLVREEGAADWTALTITEYPEKPESGNWTQAVTNNFDLKAYDGKKIQVAFRYINDGNQSVAWEVKNFKIEGKVDGEIIPEISEYDGIAAFIEAAPAAEAKLNGPITAIYRNGRYLYVKDDKDAYTLIYNNADIEMEAYTNGDRIASVNGIFKDQNGLPEIIPASFGAKTSGEAVAPEAIAIEELGSDMLNHYYVLSNVSITEGARANNYVLKDDSDVEIAGYNPFYNAQYNDVVEVPLGEGFTVEGFMSIYGTTTQFTIISVTGGKVMETVAAPVFSVAAGKVEEGTQVAIECETEGATIHYTVDGSEPTAESDVYAAPIAITDPVTIKAIAVKEGMLDSEVATASYTVARAGEVDVTFDFTDENDVKAANSTIEKAEEGKGTSLDNESFVKNDVTLAFAQGENKSNAPMWWNFNGAAGKFTEARVYVNNTMTVSTTADKLITAIVFTQNTGSTNWGGTWNDEVFSTGVYGDKSWSCDGTHEVTITVPGSSRFATMTVTTIPDPEYSAISGIDADNADAPVEYFNLQGIRVAADNLTPGIYVRRQGSETVKVLVK